jgi:transcription antitermination factor NusG
MLLMSTQSSRRADTSSDWYAVYTRHQHEKTIARILENKGFAIFLPLYESPRRWGDRIKLLSLPLLPCYVFVKGGLDRRLDILTTPGIHCFVSRAGEPALIPTVQIDGIRRAVEMGGRVEPHPFLKIGDWVRVKSGPLEGIQGILVRNKNLCRLVLSVEMLGKAAAVEVDAAQVERLSRELSSSFGSVYAMDTQAGAARPRPKFLPTERRVARLS